MGTSGSWLLDQATIRQLSERATVAVRYDDLRQMSVIDQDGREVLAVDAVGGSPTKKADIEKGEDQKDRWRP